MSVFVKIDTNTDNTLYLYTIKRPSTQNVAFVGFFPLIWHNKDFSNLQLIPLLGITLLFQCNKGRCNKEICNEERYEEKKKVQQRNM